MMPIEGSFKVTRGYPAKRPVVSRLNFLRGYMYRQYHIKNLGLSVLIFLFLLGCDNPVQKIKYKAISTVVKFKVGISTSR